MGQVLHKVAYLHMRARSRHHVSDIDGLFVADAAAIVCTTSGLTRAGDRVGSFANGAELLAAQRGINGENMPVGERGQISEHVLLNACAIALTTPNLPVGFLV